MRSLVVLALLSLCGAAVANDWIVCYFSSWARYGPGPDMFDVDDIDPFLCTHGIFGFAGLSNHTWTIEILDPWNENCPDDDTAGNYCAYERFVALKDKNPSFKAILAVGGWNERSEDYSNMLADPAKRKSFIDSSLTLVQEEGFDGLDIDWEYPTQRGGVEADRENIIILLDEFRAEFDKHGLLMTTALAPGAPTVDPSYDVAGLVRNLDVISIMTYDYHGAWEDFTHHDAPLCGYPSDEGDFIYSNVVSSVDHWLSLGVPAEKMVMGVPLHGRCFTLDNIEENGMLAAASQPGSPGPYTRLPGTQGWNEICERLKDTSDCTPVLDPSLHEPYMFCKKDKLWCGYDDEDSVYLKARFAKNRNLAGVMVWTVDTDDFAPTCSSRKFNLIHTMKEAHAEPADPNAPDCPRLTTPSTTAPTTTATPAPTNKASATKTHGPVWPAKPDCSADPNRSYYPHYDCPKYWWCVNDDAILMMCMPGLYFDANKDVCNFAEQVDTSDCREWVCKADGKTFAGAECNEYYECEQGETQPIQKFCTDGLYFNAANGQCDNPDYIDTSTCNVP